MDGTTDAAKHVELIGTWHPPYLVPTDRNPANASAASGDQMSAAATNELASIVQRG
jgi:hypothetical protein